jgi:hypothetical protein
VPQATQPPKQETAEEKADREFAAHWAEVVAAATEGDSPGARQVRRAITLEKQVAELREKVNDNRTYLRLMDRNEELSEAQAEFTDVFYPEKEKGERKPKEETQATRRAKLAARSTDNGKS